MSKTPRFLVKVFLYQIEPEIWRRFSIPATATFKQLHDAVQHSMGWEDIGTFWRRQTHNTPRCEVTSEGKVLRDNFKTIKDAKMV